jgi:DNA processing protein
MTSYGKQVIESLLRGLQGYPICIVSGLALGVDAYAHTQALECGLPTIAVPGSGLNDTVLYPKNNFSLAQRILKSGGALLSEYEPNFKATEWSFPQRNRIMAGMCHATLVVEAGEKSGTLITARLTVDYNRELLVVPGNIFSDNSKGVHQFLKLGATPVTCAEDILEALQLAKITTEIVSATKYTVRAAKERRILELLAEPITREILFEKSGMSIGEFSTTLTILEIEGLVDCTGVNILKK